MASTLENLADSLKLFIIETYGNAKWDKTQEKTTQVSTRTNKPKDGEKCSKESDVFDGGSVGHMRNSLKTLSQIAGKHEDQVMEAFGRFAFDTCLKQPQGKILFYLGNSLCDFLNSLDNFLEIFIQSHECLRNAKAPTFSCKVMGRCLELHYYPTHSGWEHFIIGSVTRAAHVLFKRNVLIKLEDTGRDPDHRVFSIREKDQQLKTQNSLATKRQLRSTSPQDLPIGVQTLCSTFPFHVILDKELQIKQMGSALLRLIGPAIRHDRKFSTYFELDQPDITLGFQPILCRINATFSVQLKSATQIDDSGKRVTLMELKGQMIHLPESNAILFLVSPLVEKLEQLKGRGLFLSDIPIHDATRDLILVSEQANAQDGLKKRMEQIQKELQQASSELEEEKKKTENLLSSIFPHDVANKLINKQPIPARHIQNVTMLFSDIVGFTAICGKCSAMDVVEMLKSLYTKFDKLCGELDLYKVETIGDAYVVAGGVQNHCGTAEDAYHVALMAVGMIDHIRDVLSPEGVPLKMRVGIHTGSVLSGVVGTKMPRYCLFGHDVTLANKMESESEAGRINISPTTYELIREHKEFIFTERPRSALPDGFSSHVQGTCHFLEKKATSLKHDESLWEKLESSRIRRKTSPDTPIWDTEGSLCDVTDDTVTGLTAKTFLDDVNNYVTIEKATRNSFKETTV